MRPGFMNQSPSRRSIRSDVSRGLLAASLWFVVCILIAPPCVAQPTDTPRPDPHAAWPYPVVEPQSSEFKAANEALRENLKSIRHTIVRFHTSNSTANDRQLRKELRELQMQSHDLRARWLEAAMAEYRAAPGGRKELADMLFRHLEKNMEEDRYEGMLELVKLLIDNGYEHEEFNLLVAKAAFGNQDFDLYREYVQKVMEGGMELSPVYQAIFLNTEQMKDAWQAELAARAADAEGEPLPRILIKTTKGDIEVELFENQAPQAVANIIHLAERGFYDNLAFHRVLKHFVAQGGCPIGDGSGGPEYCIRNEAGRPDARLFFRGTLGVALSQHPDSGGSQFFITFVPTPELNTRYTAFGRVINGWDALVNLTRIDPEKKDDDESGKPAPIADEIITIEVLSKRDHPYVPEKLERRN
jgi:cyclophilin family peptidyl-prolyl cis-trans isomerase